jgi:YVTN family beta-propeller protein
LEESRPPLEDFAPVEGSRGRPNVGIALALAFVAVVAVVLQVTDSDRTLPHVGARAGSRLASSSPERPTREIAQPVVATVPHDPARDFAPTQVATITGEISPKSVTATGTGLVFAQNMMYTHTVTVYDHDGKLVKTIPDGVDLAQFGIADHPGISQGAPVEAAVDTAQKHVFVSNYSMYGANFGPEGSDDCGGPGGLSPSYVYRINLASLAVDGVAQVGMVPKYVAVTPDDRYVLVTNWCSYDLSVVDHTTLQEVHRIPIGQYPRGIAVDPQSRVAYIAVMGSYDIARVDLQSFEVSWFQGVGSGPRHLVLSPDGSRLYATLNGAGEVVTIDTATGEVVARAATGSEPRSMAMSSDGRALYVVNYTSNTVSVLDASDLSVVGTLPVPGSPIGIAYEPTAHRVWVACYSGEIVVYDA